MIDAWYDIHGLIKVHLYASEKNSAGTVDRLLASFRSEKFDESQLQLEFFDSIDIKPDESNLNAGGIFYNESSHMVWDSLGAVKIGPSGKITVYTDKGIDKFAMTLLLTIQLARQHLALCHAMGIVTEDGAILFPAWKNTGKTGLFNYYTQQENTKVLGDELMIVSRKGDIYSIPYPLVIQHYHAADKPTALGKAYRKKRNIYLGYTIDPFLDYVARPIVNSLSFVSPRLVRLLKRNAPERGITTPIETVNVTTIGSRMETIVPAMGYWLITWSVGTVSLDALTIATVKFLFSNFFTASACDIPTTFGTSTSNWGSTTQKS